MKIKYNIAIIILAFFIIFFSYFVYADSACGIYKIPIKNGWNFISLPMQTIQSSEGLITSKTSNTITDNTKAWTINAYENYILLISSGSGEGYWYKVVSNTSNTLTLSSSLSSSISVGSYFYIYKTFTLTELFGDYTGPLYASSNKGTADEIYLWDPDTQSFSSSIWLSNVPGQEGWWRGTTHITNNSISLLPNEACFVVRKISLETTVNYVGIVPNTKQVLNIKSGDSVIGESYPASVALNSSGLNDVINSGVSSYSADHLYKWDYANQRFGTPIWHSNYPGYEGWYQGSTNVDSMTLDPAEGMMIKNRSTEKNWQRVKPYTVP
jgi:hypothetical protein